MTRKRRAEWVSVLIRLFVMCPIWFYLTHQVLVRIQATELMWFLFWIYVPLVVLSILIGAIWLSDE